MAQERMSRPTIIFDLDRVLYPLEHALEQQAVEHCHRRVPVLLGWTQDAYDAFRREQTDAIHTHRLLQEQHGLSLLDMLADYHEHLDYHLLEPCVRTRQLLDDLPVRKVIYTDGTRAHAAKVLAHTGLEGCFEDICDISVFVKAKRVMDFVDVLAYFNSEAAHTTMVDDRAANLERAKLAGIRTVWMTATPDDAPAFVDETVATLPDWLEREATRLGIVEQ